MGISGEDIKNKLYLRLNMYGLADDTTSKLLNMYIETVAMELAAEKWYDDLLKTEYFTTDSNGKFTVEANVIPYAVFAYGTEGESHSWQRLTAVEYEYFLNWDSRAGVMSTGSGRYTILPEGDADNTVIQTLDDQSSISIKLVYYPIRPAIEEFPTYFEPLITGKVLEAYLVDKGDQFKDRSLKLLMDQNKNRTKLAKKQAKTFEINMRHKTAINQKVKGWLSSEQNSDIGFWFSL